MGNKNPAEWFVIVQGNRLGPYSADQVAALARTREVQLDDRVTSPKLQGTTVSVQEFVSAVEIQNRNSPQSLRPFSAPPRPPEETTQIGIALPKDEGDPTADLLSALQAVREKQVQAKLTAPTPEEWGSFSRKRPSVSRQAFLVAGVFGCLGILVWGTYSITRQPERHLAENHPAEPATKQVPATTPPPEPATPVKFGSIQVISGGTKRTITPAPQSLPPTRTVEPPVEPPPILRNYENPPVEPHQGDTPPPPAPIEDPNRGADGQLSPPPNEGQPTELKTAPSQEITPDP
jgi:hypothetical protein